MKCLIILAALVGVCRAGDAQCTHLEVLYSEGQTVPSEDPCNTTCVCESDGSISCQTLSCRLTTSCGGLELVVPPGECCPKCPLCDVDGVSYEPGDQIPLGDPCSLHCTCTGERRIACSSIQIGCAPPRCLPGTKLEVGPVQPGQCCPTFSCVNCTCDVDGVCHDDGDDIPSDDPCQSCQCTAVDGPICLSISCAIPDCEPLGLQVITKPDQCCPQCGCVVNGSGKSYCIGDAIPHENPCTDCRCTDTGIECFSRQCDIPDCASLGLEVVYSEGQCCPGCGCRVNGISYNVGDNVCDRDPCTTCVCTDSGVLCSTQPCGLSSSCGGLKPEVPPGECCPKCPLCDVDGVSYEPGDRIPLGDPCSLHCICTAERRIACSLRLVLCESPLGCQDGLLPVSDKEPGQCCPTVTCENTTCLHEGEGAHFRIGQKIPTNDPCQSCECTNTGAVLCASEQCELPEACHPELQLLVDKDQCCSSECGCVVNGSGKSYSIGDAIPHENPCTDCRCTDTGIECFSRQCDIPDCASLGLEVVSSEDQCCPGCGCRVNGISYNVGDDVCDRDPCTTCVCTDSGVQCSAVGCPLIGCGPGTCLKSVPVPGQCCPHQECVSTTCEYEGRNYTAGPVPTGDPCTVCECTCEGVQCLSASCAIPDCEPLGLQVITKPDQCCPLCGCKVNGTSYCIGDNVCTGDPCSKCRCTENGVACDTQPCGLSSSCGGLKPVVPPGECCPKCPLCDVDGVSYMAGDRIPLGDPCSLHCICTAERRIACSLRFVLCESPLSCQDGLLPVSDKEPGQCCPTVTCENTTCLYEGTHYRIGQNIPTNNPCRSCECSNTGAVLCASALCGVPEAACHPELQLLEDKDQCCSSECGCVVNGSGKSYSIGDAIPHENPCTGCLCTDTGIRCFSIQCDIPDCASLGLEVVCSEGQCCPGCGCRVNGISYNVGEDVCDRDPCTTCVCTDSGVQCSAVGCPLIACGPGMCLKSVPVPGQCCPHQECVSTTCEYEGRNYSAGPVPTGDPCTVCECTCGGVQCLASLCAIPECGNDTSYRLVRKEGECCPQCRCDVDGQLYDQGQAIPQNDSCVDCICAEGGKTCSAYGCPLLGCIPGTVLTSVPVPGQCCPNQTCVPDCPPTCSKSYCRGANKNAVCSRPSGSDGNSNSCLRPLCAVTTCKACYYNANHRPLPGGCERVSTCEAVKNKPKKLVKCLKKWGQCIGKKDKAQYGKVLRSNQRQRDFKCYSYPC